MTYKDWDLINDENLIRGITVPLAKKAQEAQQQANAASAISVARKLSKNLVRTLSNQGPVPNITATPPQGQADVSLKADNVANLDVLLDYLWKNKVAVDNEQIVYRSNEITDEKVDEWHLAELDGKTTREADQRGVPTRPGQPGAAPTRRWETQKYFFRQPLLVKYIQYLQQKAADMKAKPSESPESSTGQLLSVYVGKLITDLNNRASTNIPAQPRAQPGQPTVLPDDTVLDTFAAKSFDAKAPGRAQVVPNSLIELHAGNLKSQEALNAWLQGSGDTHNMGGSNQVAQITEYDDQNQKTEGKDYRENPCVVVQALYLRARAGRGTQATAEARKGAEYYFAKIQEIGPQFNDPEGNACSVTTAATNPNAQQGQQGQQGQGKGTLSPEMLNQVLDSLPLQLGDINFARIETFKNAYFKLIPVLQTDAGARQRVPNMRKSIEYIGQAMTNAKACTPGSSRSVFPGVDGLNAATVQSWCQSPTTAYANNLTAQLKQVVTYVVALLSDLQSAYGKRLEEDQQSTIAQQLDIGQDNIDNLQNAEQHLPGPGRPGQPGQ